MHPENARQGNAIKSAPSQYNVKGRCSVTDFEIFNSCRRRYHLATRATVSQAGLIVKICGITNIDDAAKAVDMGANLIGMILWPHAKRSISVEQAREISRFVTRHGAAPVAVFVDENAMKIAQVCDQAGIDIAQLHGDASRAAINDLPKGLRTVYVINVDDDGKFCCSPPPSAVDWILLDSMKGGSGKSLKWELIRVDTFDILCKSGWILAGGLHPNNVAKAINVAAPMGVDVSSGVCGPDGLRKDANLMRMFIQQAKFGFGME